MANNVEIIQESLDSVVKVENKPKSLSLKHMEISCDVDKMPVDVYETLNKYTTIKHWAYIIHDKDDTRAHYHIYIHFGGASVKTDYVASWFGIAPNFVNKIKSTRVKALEYLTHSLPSQKHKYQYDKSEVISNFDFQTEIDNSKTIGNFEQYSYAQQLDYVHSLPVEERTRAFAQLKKLWDLECQHLSLNTDRQISVMFVTGKGGTGKSFWAKKILKDVFKYDFYVSSSSNDPMQDYKGQRAIIFDDMRPRSKNNSEGFSFDDLLKVLDNNTNSSIKSRFNNKVFTGEMIVITSSIPICYWYSELRFNALEDLNQLYRRISCYVNVTEDEITVFNDGLDSKGKPVGLGTIYVNNIKELLKEEKQKNKVDFNSAFSQICKPLTVNFEVQGNFLKEKDYG